MSGSGQQRPSRRVTVIGAGIAGASVAWTLAERGWQVRVLEASRAGAGGSGNPVAILYPKLVAAAQTPLHLQSMAFLQALEILRDPRLAPHFRQTGVLWLDQRKQKADIGPDHPWWGEQVWRVDAAEASRLAGLPLPMSALWLPHAGVLRPAGLLAALLARPGITLVEGCPVHDLQPAADGWRLSTALGEEHADAVVLAHAGATGALHAGNDAGALPLKPVRGQVSLTPAGTQMLQTTLCYGGYLAPVADGGLCLGATFQPGRSDTDITHEDHLANARELEALLPALAAALPTPAIWQGRASLRWQTPDYLPLAGHLPWLPGARRTLATQPPGARQPRWDDHAPLLASLGHGAKGFTQAWPVATLIADLLEEKTPVMPTALAERLRPDRFLLRDWRRGLFWRQPR